MYYLGPNEDIRLITLSLEPRLVVHNTRTTTTLLTNRKLPLQGAALLVSLIDKEMHRARKSSPEHMFRRCSCVSHSASGPPQRGVSCRAEYLLLG